ncbi:SDR family oxidoreductase [Aminobacter sp. AP02]|uniref:SDR family NAD(P)-dependent oxidoreductase n=1 Tax=Aminobacter sp. AP02 TaxID=2135737 RepID=UPI000D6CC4BE|nr:SDR family oxidoreductase [Aminobacter sp. AP02]PWK75643.1 NADP-dependent 3-hydroxy acid dehydrogenase YdfG [Aminobacter sp. AP02]
MLLKNKTAVVYGGGGAIGGAAAKAFARDGARVFLGGRTRSRMEAVAAEIRAEGGFAEIAILDALDELAVERHADAVAQKAGGIDIALNAVGIAHVQGTPLAELSLADFETPVAAYTRSNFLTAKAVARHMQGRGVILTLSTPGARMSGVGFLGNGVASAAVEAMSRILAGELGARGIRVICLRPDAIPESLEISHARAAFEGFAKRAGMPVDDMLAARAASGPLLRRFPTLAQIGDFAAFVASDRAGAMTGAIANLSCGTLVD